MRSNCDFILLLNQLVVPYVQHRKLVFEERCYFFLLEACLTDVKQSNVVLGVIS